MVVQKEELDMGHDMPLSGAVNVMVQIAYSAVPTHTVLDSPPEHRICRQCFYRNPRRLQKNALLPTTAETPVYTIRLP